MADDKKETTTPPEQFAETTPKGPLRSYDEMNTGHMVFEMQGTLGELKSTVEQMRTTAADQSKRLESIENFAKDIRNAISALLPKIEDVGGFIKHRAPHLADKADIEKVRSELSENINKRPTRRQSITDLLLVIGFVGTIIAIASHLGMIKSLL